jgi:polyisoprenoid-binding protein YceI
MMKKLSIFAVMLLLSATTFAQTWAADKAHTKLAFTVTHLGISEVDGVFKINDASISGVKEDFSDAVFTLSADVKSVSTGNEMRDGHLQKPDMFDTEKFPTLTFKSTAITKVADKKFKLVGDLTIKGVTKSYTLDLTLMGTSVDQRSKKQKVGFKATGTIKRTDFGVSTMPAMMLSEDVELRASGEFVHN